MVKEIHFIAHALEQMHERGISKQDVHKVLLSPHDEYPCAKPNRRRASLDVGDGRVLEIVFKSKPYGYLVVTAFWKGDA